MRFGGFKANGESDMTLTGHWNRIEDRIGQLWPRETLERETELWRSRLEKYSQSIRDHQELGGAINRSHDFAFRFIVRKSIERAQDKINLIDALYGRIAVKS